MARTSQYGLYQAGVISIALHVLYRCYYVFRFSETTKEIKREKVLLLLFLIKTQLIDYTQAKESHLNWIVSIFI